MYHLILTITYHAHIICLFCSATTNMILRKEGCRILESEKISREQKMAIRSTIIECILATDMAHHVSMCENLTKVSEKIKETGEPAFSKHKVEVYLDGFFYVKIWRSRN